MSREPPQRDGAWPRDAKRRRRSGVRLNALMDKEKLDGKIEYCNCAMDSSVENMYVNKVWVQCENENCLKWRLLSSEDAAKVDHDEPWYCFMNTDSRYNNCSISEEDFPEESQLHQCGFKIVYSQLPLGSLVLVKLQNWPSWPGILCPDRFKGKYVTYDPDGNVEEYHIEFLGDPHSRSWIKATFVGHYSITLKINPKHMTKLLHWPRKGSRFLKVILKRRSPNLEKGKVVSETEVLLKELEQMLQQALQPTVTPDESEEGLGEEINMGEKLSKCSPEASAGSLFENHYEEDYLVIDGIKLKAGECIEDITNKFKEIDALMSEF
ncbi:zinc finger CW-type PWWP domain protein 2 isoform X2 [Piliocolobus tephrosceles]|uniref:zinc finger CW-type PWWP domain protein 2 isoform X2 n=1 Tax=Piliocolobus tephrosceles TaxID=591936 RepID=UPI0013010ADE|nr:zinc finger CW-type PWWP domain protein 2 isoform X2 [Piliocolobus tephrosceles]